MARKENLSAHLLEFQSVMEEIFALRQSAVSFFENAQDTEVLSGNDLIILGRGMDAHLRLKDALLAYQGYYQRWGSNARKARAIPLLTRIKGVLVSLNAGLALYDHYALAMYMYEKNPRLNTILNTGDKSFDRKRNELLKSGVSFHSLINRQKIRRSVKFIDDNAGFIHAMSHDEELAYLFICSFK